MHLKPVSYNLQYYGLDVSASKVVAELKVPLEIPGRDEAIKEYGEWQVKIVTDDTLKAAFR